MADSRNDGSISEKSNYTPSQNNCANVLQEYIKRDLSQWLRNKLIVESTTKDVSQNGSKIIKAGISPLPFNVLNTRFGKWYCEAVAGKQILSPNFLWFVKRTNTVKDHIKLFNSVPYRSLFHQEECIHSASLIPDNFERQIMGKTGCRLNIVLPT